MPRLSATETYPCKALKLSLPCDLANGMGAPAPPLVRLLAVGQRAGAVNDVPRAHSIFDDTSEQSPDCLRICRLGEEQPQGGFGVHDDSADRLVDFGNRRR